MLVDMPLSDYLEKQMFRCIVLVSDSKNELNVKDENILKDPV